MNYKTPIEKIEKNESYGVKVYRQLKDLIISGTIIPGTVINEREYSQLLGVSRTPLRDAIRMLETEGWIQEEGSSRIVSVFTWRTIKDLLEIREPFEQLTFRLAMENATESDLEKLGSINDRMKQYNGLKDLNYYEAMQNDTDFHRYVGYMTRNRTLVNMQNVMYEKIVRSSVLSMRISHLDPPSFAKTHAPLIECLKAKDAEAGRKAVTEHCALWKGRLIRLPEILGFDTNDDDYVIHEGFIETENNDIRIG